MTPVWPRLQRYLAARAERNRRSEAYRRMVADHDGKAAAFVDRVAELQLDGRAIGGQLALLLDEAYMAGVQTGRHQMQAEFTARVRAGADRWARQVADELGRAAAVDVREREADDP